jgi:hypothetical protein
MDLDLIESVVDEGGSSSASVANEVSEQAFRSDQLCDALS